MKVVELYGRVRYAVQIEGLSRREAARQSANYITHQLQINAERSTSTGIRLSDTTRTRTWLKARQVAEGLNSTPDRSISARVIFAISPVAGGNQCTTFVADVRARVSDKFLGLALCGNHV